MHPTWNTCAKTASFNIVYWAKYVTTVYNYSIDSVANAEDSNSYKQTGRFN